MSFLDIYGHERQTAMLQKAIAQKRVGHAYLFSGINAIGKRTLAGKFAMALNCEKADKIQDACGKCSSCLKIQHSSHLDMILIKPDGQFIRIESIRDLQEQMKFKPFEGRWRAVIIDEADKMNDVAANALLKTLEEPSAFNILMLISSRPHSMLATIISRCRHMRFNPLPAAAIARFLVGQKGMEQQKANLIAGLSGGSIGRALELDQEDILAYRQEILQILMETRRDNPVSVLKFSLFFSQDKNEIRQRLDILNSFFRDALVLKETRKNEMLINQDQFSSITALARRLTGEQILQNISILTRSWEAIEQNVNKTLTLEAMAFKLNL